MVKYIYIFYNITVKLYQINAAFEYETTKHFLKILLTPQTFEW